MTDPVAKAKALEAQAMARRPERLDAKLRIWNLIQEQYPDHAQFLKSVSATFGKPAKVEITTNEGKKIL